MVRKALCPVCHVCARMSQCTAVFTCTLLILTCFCCVHAKIGILNATACYGNYNNYLRLECAIGEFISVINIYHGAKLKKENCISPASSDTYREECCEPQDSDCTFLVQDSASVVCEGFPECQPTATWSSVHKECDRNKYPMVTNYMLMYYKCIKEPSSIMEEMSSTKQTTKEPTSETSTQALTDPLVVINTTLTLTTVTPENTKHVSMVLTGNKQESKEEELSDAMIGAIVGGCLGMLLTLVVFIFYWGRKRHLRIVGKPQPTVWDYLLSQTFTVRGTRGYDHFSSVRSLAISEGDTGSPVVRKNMWLPNIVHKDEENPEDMYSNYDNDSDKHYVEIHPNAKPSPYAILSLDASSAHQANHEA